MRWLIPRIRLHFREDVKVRQLVRRESVSSPVGKRCGAEAARALHCPCELWSWQYSAPLLFSLTSTERRAELGNSSQLLPSALGPPTKREINKC